MFLGKLINIIRLIIRKLIFTYNKITSFKYKISKFLLNILYFKRIIKLLANLINCGEILIIK